MKCSICMSTRNKAPYLRNVLASIYRQTPPFDFEVIVVDDGGTDETEEVCEAYPELRYFYINNPRYRNPSTARNVAFRAAKGEIVLAQSDDIVHVSPTTIQFLVSNLRKGEFLLARTHNYTYKDGKPFEFRAEYCGPSWPKPYFFLGAISRKDLCAVGGYDEEFKEPCYDDNWLADCLLNGLKLKVRYTEEVLAHHQGHGYEAGSHDRENDSRQLYNAKVKEAKRTGKWVNSKGPMPLEPREPVTQPKPKPSLTGPMPRQPLSSPEGRVPKRMNLFWSSPRMSWMRYMTVHSFRKFHPDWRIVMYSLPSESVGGKTWASSETQDSQTYQGQDYSHLLKGLAVERVTWQPNDSIPKGLAPSHACDLCQWEILSTVGGWYCDMDILWVKPLPYEETKDWDALFCLTDAWMAIGLMAGVPEGQVYKDILAAALNNYNPKKYQSTGAEAIYRMAEQWPHWGGIERVGVKALNVLKRRYPQLSIHDVPQVTVYPWNYLQTAKIFTEVADVPGGCCGIHWFGGNDLAQKYNQKLTYENYREFRNTYCLEAAKVLA